MLPFSSASRSAALPLALGVALLVLTSACDALRHEPDATNFTEVAPPQTAPTATLNADGDTLRARGETHILYDAGLKDLRLERVLLFVDGSRVDLEDVTEERVIVDARLMDEGVFPFRFVVRAFSNSESLASELGAEVVTDTLTGTFVVDNQPPERITGTAAAVRDGLVEVRWSQYPSDRAGFRHYTVYRGSNSPTQFVGRVDSRSTPTLRDRSFTGGTTKYWVVATVQSVEDRLDVTQSPPGSPAPVDVPHPVLREPETTSTETTISWTAPRAYGAFSNYLLYYREPDDTNWTLIKQTSDPTDTVYVAPRRRFGSGEVYRLLARPNDVDGTAAESREYVAWPRRMIGGDLTFSQGYAGPAYLPALDSYLRISRPEGSSSVRLRRYDADQKVLEAEGSVATAPGGQWIVGADGRHAYRLDGLTVLEVDLRSMQATRQYDLAPLVPDRPHTAFAFGGNAWIANGRLFSNLKVNTVRTSDVVLVADLDPLRRIAFIDWHHPTDRGTVVLDAVSPEGDHATLVTYERSEGRFVETLAVGSDTLEQTGALPTQTSLPITLLPDDFPDGADLFLIREDERLELRRLSDHGLVRRLDLDVDRAHYDPVTHHFAIYAPGSPGEITVVDPQGTVIRTVPIIPGNGYAFVDGTLWDYATGYLDVFAPLPFQ